MKNNGNNKLIILTIAAIVFTFIVNVSMITFAYFVQTHYAESFKSLDVNLIFGRLDPSVNPSGPWGTDTNPYLIEEPNHFINLYTLQNRADKRIINEDTVFQVSDKYGKPNFVGGISANNLMQVTSIGTEEFPFVSLIRGVKATNQADFITLPTGERSDTSVIGNMKVVAEPGQFDIGLFGNVGPRIEPQDGEPVGEITTLLLYNMQISSDAVGVDVENHRHFVTSAPYETNHIGLLVGHAQFTKINNISVYYSGPNQNKDVKAFDVKAGTSAKYTTAQGIIGYYTDIVINDEDSPPLSSTGFVDQLGDTNTGLGLGIIYAEDLWSFMEKNAFDGVPQTGDDYSLQDTFGAELYAENMPGKRAFNIGVFTFAHSKQSQGKDRLEQIWPDAGTENWNVSTTNSYNQSLQTQGAGKRYTVKQITNNDMAATSFTLSGQTRYKHSLKAPYNTANYRFLLTVTSNSKEFAIIRYGYSAVAKEIEFQSNNGVTSFTIPENDINYYTFEPLEQRTANNAYPPYETNAAFRYYQRHNFTYYGNYVTAQKQFAGYGNEVIDPDDNSRYIEGVRPLRVLWLSNTNRSVTFNASSAANSIEGINLRPWASGNSFVTLTNTPANTNYSQFAIERTRDTDGRPANTPYFLQFSEAGGLTAGTGIAGSAKAKLYAVRVTPGGADSPVNTNFQKLISTPTAGVRTIDMSENVLMYTGTPSSVTPSTRYRYNLQTLASLSWSDNKGKPLEKAEKALTMGDVTSYYYIDSGNNPYWGVALNLPSPIQQGQFIKVPEASIGFTVNGTNKNGTTAKVYVIVASDPTLNVNQEITISRFGTNANQTGQRTVIQTMVLPPVPALTSGKTHPIQVTENGGAARPYYPNLNRLLVGYEFTVPSRYTVTYFLEASIGLASFVYLSAERTAATDNNPTHENKINFPHLSNIDFIRKSTTDNDLFTVGHANYESTLTSLYFGLKPNPANPTGELPNIDPVLVSITTGLNFTYEVGRAYNVNEEKHTLYVTVIVENYGYPTAITKNQLIAIMDNYQFEFSEWSYINPDTYEYNFSDIVVMRINNFTITDWVANLT